MLPKLDEETGFLPLGRFNVPLEHVREYYVDNPRFVESTTRSQIWNDFLSVSTELRSHLRIISVWIGGSFLTSKVDPDDIDLCFWFDDRHFDRDVARISDNRNREIIQLVAKNQIRAQTGLRVDTRFGFWHLDKDAPSGGSEAHGSYVSTRGYWDDLWMRKRTGSKTDPSQLSDALPRRGYFEITLDDFHAI